MYIECKRLVEEQNQDNWASEVKQTLAGCGGIGPLVMGSQITLACSHLLFLSSRKGEVANWSFIQPKAEIIHQLENWSSYVQKVRVKSHRSLIGWEEEQHHYKLKLVDTSAFQWKRWYAVMQHRAGAWKMTSISVWDVQLWKRLEHLPPPIMWILEHLLTKTTLLQSCRAQTVKELSFFILCF